MVLHGKGVSAGLAAAKLHWVQRAPAGAEPVNVEDPEAEVARFESARVLAVAQLGQLAEREDAGLGAENTFLFEVHQMLLEDEDYRETIEGIIRDRRLCAEYAVAEASKKFEDMFAQMDSEYMQARAADVIDISRRVMAILTGADTRIHIGDESVILASDDFSPSETAQLDRKKVLGFVTQGGTTNSHTAIFARTIGIPAIVGLGEQIDRRMDGNPALLLGDDGLLIVNPDADAMAAFDRKQKDNAALKAGLVQYRGRPSVTRSGRKVKLFSNISSPADATAALEGDAEGVGLFRSEFLYLENCGYPSEEMQYSAYREVLQKMAGRTVVIRTLDIGADKQAPYFQLPEEANPAMGMRAIRICLTRPEIFITQLRALYRASIHGTLAIMFPMITGVEELRRAKALAAQARQQLEAEEIPYNEATPLGIMIETPASAIISDVLAKEVDFFSVGTNDLIQYTLAMDRQNDSMAPFCDTHHEAVLRLIEWTAKNARENGIWIGICGELGGDTDLTERFIRMGIDEFSVAPSDILRLRAHIAGIL